jgi:hypothetical protein
MNDNFTATVECLKALSSKDTFYNEFINAAQADAVRKAIDLMTSQIKCAIDDGKPEITGADMTAVKESLSILNNTFLTQLVSEDFNTFIKQYVGLVFNWNSLAQNQDIGQYLQGLNNLVVYQNTVVETMQVLKVLIREVKGMKDFMPPAFKVSKHYLQAIQDELVKNNV